MKKLLVALSVVSAVAMSAGSAAAQWSPAPSGPHDIYGDLIVRQTLPFDLPCPFANTVMIDGSGVARTNDPLPASLCTSGLGTGVLMNSQWTITRSGSTVTVSNIDITALGGTCVGTVTGTIRTPIPPAPPPTIIDIPYQMVVGPNTPPCYIGGTVYVDGVV